MSVKEYEFIDPFDGPFGKVLRRWFRLHPIGAARLISALDDFVERGCSLSCIATAKNGEGREIYLEPPRYVLASLPDAAWLIRVNHAKRTIEVVHLLELYGGVGEAQQWDQVVITAAGFL